MAVLSFSADDYPSLCRATRTCCVYRVSEPLPIRRVDALLGLQWGDEGKGKIVDILAPRYDIVARFQGGPNAGHTLEFDDQRHVLHQIPSGIFRRHGKNVIGNGVVLDPILFRREIEELEKCGIDARKTLYISNKAALILPTHRLLDRAYEEEKGESRIGSTLKGIGPSYQDKVGRQGLRVGDARVPGFAKKLDKLAAAHLDKLGDYDLTCDWADLKARFLDAVDFLLRFTLIDSEYFFSDALRSGATVLAEGAQGSLLDLDFGSYPFVTSSNTVAAGACTGLGIAPAHMGAVLGVFKAYSTRVGEGPFPTELTDGEGEKMRQAGNEFGSTTGRPRRCGWLDLPALKYALMINGVSRLFMMKADVLSAFPRIKVCTAYRLEDGTTTDRLPHDWADARLTPVYAELEGWNVPLDEPTEKNMPAQLSAYIAFLEKELGMPISLVSTGPDRLQTIVLGVSAGDVG